MVHITGGVYTHHAARVYTAHATRVYTAHATRVVYIQCIYPGGVYPEVSLSPTILWEKRLRREPLSLHSLGETSAQRASHSLTYLGETSAQRASLASQDC